MAKHRTNGKRNRRSKAKVAYAKAREDAQIRGIIGTSPEGAVRNERVDPASQAAQLILDIPVRAAREDWATAPEVRGRIVREIEDVVLSAETPPVVKVMGANTLGKLDQMQWERDHPEEAGKAKGGVKVESNVSVISDIRELLQKVEEQKRIGVEDEQGQSEGGVDQGDGPGCRRAGQVADGGDLHEPVLQEQKTPQG